MSGPLKIPEYVLQEQYTSSNPETSAWVAANAGSGKTHVLTQRVIRLMLAGNAPDRILCLTFTKAAAANMKTRVFDTLARWTMMEDGELGDAIQAMTGEPATNRTRNRARQLFTLALDTPGGLKIQTIHAYCEALLHQFPLEANVPGHFETLQETGQTALLEEAKARILAGRSGSEELIEHYRALSAFASQSAIEAGIAAIVAGRNSFMDWIASGIENALQPLYAQLGVEHTDTESSIRKHCLEQLPLSHAELQAITQIAGESDKPTDQDMHAHLLRVLNEETAGARFEALGNATLTRKGEPKSTSRIVTKYVKDRIPDVAENLVACAEAVIAANQRINALRLLENSERLFRIAEAVIEQYVRFKRRRGVVDFDDLVDKCASLLNRHDISEWIRYRLDRGIDHVLVDEAQDTSPRQWEIINAITADFHVGETAASRHRTMFVVGDEKQSIYSFQGARPDEFARQEQALKRAVGSAQKKFHPGRLALSFRSTRDVLHAVDLVFASEENRQGLMQSGEAPVHDAVREKDPGEVQVWPLFIKEKEDPQESWLDPVDHASRVDPAVMLADRIASSIKDWVSTPLSGDDKPLQYKDILVLVRKRDRFIPALTRTMKDRGLQVAGADRLVLTDHIAVEDLLALGQFVLLPRDDLNLACVLKGVLFNIDEETLFDFAQPRGEMTLLQAIENAAKDGTHEHHLLAIRLLEKLGMLQNKAQQFNVFEFFAWVLGPFGMRKALLSRLGAEAEDVLDAFLDETVDFIREGGIDLEAFILNLKGVNPEIKREVELERDEVRILTVHASKGLEARVVFLVDPSNAPWSESHRPPILPIETGEETGHIWLPAKDLHVDATRKSTDTIRETAEAEYRRLLYVGMTRAADRLVVCGYRGSNEPGYETWHSMVQSALEPSGVEITDEAGNPTGIRWRETPRSAAEASAKTELPQPEAKPVAPLPDWLVTPVRHEKPLPAPLTPTGAFALIDKAELDHARLNRTTGKVGAGFAIQKGKAVHRLLETLPDLEASARGDAANRYLERIGKDWTPEQRADVWSDIKSILESVEFAHLFSGRSSAEVALTGKLQTRSGERLIAGQIDRLVIQDQSISIIDYKTNFTIPPAPKDVPRQYLSQMALYRELVKQIYPNHAVRSFLLWVHGPNLMNLPDILLDTAYEDIKNI